MLWKKKKCFPLEPRAVLYTLLRCISPGYSPAEQIHEPHYAIPTSWVVISPEENQLKDLLIWGEASIMDSAGVKQVSGDCYRLFYSFKPFGSALDPSSTRSVLDSETLGILGLLVLIAIGRYVMREGDASSIEEIRRAEEKKRLHLRQTQGLVDFTANP